MEWEYSEDQRYPGDWRVEAINDSGDIYVAIFSGPDAEQRALEYSAFKNQKH